MSSCGGTKILSLYDTTFTYTGETLPLEWNKSMGTVWFETDSHKEIVKQLLIKHWNEVDWEITKNYWNELMVSLGKNNDVTQGINDKTTSSVDEFINYFNLIGNNFYSELKDVSITVGSKSEKVDVTLHVPNKSDVTYECYSLGENAVEKNILTILVYRKFHFRPLKSLNMMHYIFLCHRKILVLIQPNLPSHILLN